VVRKTFKKIITSNELLAQVNPENIKLAKRLVAQKACAKDTP
jgi:hypothetical protein